MIYILNPKAPEWNRKEIIRYARAKSDDPRITALIDACIAEAKPLLDYRLSYTIDDIVREDDTLSFCGINTASTVIKKAVDGCEKIILFAATIGARFDRLITRYGRLEPSKALIFQAIGAERIESLCDAFCDTIITELNASGKSLRQRVSPGYGDIPLEMQRQIFQILDCERRIGLTLNESLLMSPSKSVTAIVGVGSDRHTSTNPCDGCNRPDCIYKK